jgi:type IV secretory pathway protease TraF
MTIGAVVILAGTIVAHPSPIYIWNSSESVPLGLYRMRAASKYYVTELVAVQPPEPLATYLNRNGYLPTGVPMLKRVLALPGGPIRRGAVEHHARSSRKAGQRGHSRHSAF